MENIKAQFKTVVSYSQSIEAPQIDELFERWAEAKRDIRHFLLGDQLIKNLGEYSFPIDENTKRHKLQAFREWLDRYYPITETLIAYLNAITPNEFYNNCLENDYDIDGKIVRKGSKAIRNFKHFIVDTDRLSSFQDKASELIQENKISGELCLSIHPLDFLSASENVSRWRSCHALDGEYRAGNLSYMVDETTVICYLQSSDGAVYQLPNFPSSVPWNNKKWRCFLYFDDIPYTDLVFAGRQYPMQVDGILDKLKDYFQSKAKRLGLWDSSPVDFVNWTSTTVSNITLGDDYTLKPVINNSFYYLNGHLYDSHRLIKDAPESLHYNDLLYSSCYKPLYTYNKNGSGSTLLIGAPVNCLRCGHTHITTRDTFMCLDCELEYGDSESDEYGRCDYCGRRRLVNDLISTNDGCVCEDCAESHTQVCAGCGYRFNTYDTRYDEDRGCFYCCECYDERN